MKSFYYIWRLSLINDLRSMIHQPGSKKKTGWISHLILPLFLSLSLTLSLFQTEHLFHFTFYILSFSMLMTAFSIMIELGTRIMRPEDIEIWMVHPISARSLYLAKFTQILTFVWLLTGITIFVPTVLSFLRPDSSGWLPLILFGTALLANGFVTAILVIFYTGMAHMLSVRKSKNIVGFLQLLIALLLIGIHQWTSYIPQWDSLDNALREQPLLYALPPFWFATVIEWLRGVWTGSLLLPVMTLFGSIAFWFLVLMRIPVHYQKISLSENKNHSSNRKSGGLILHFMDKLNLSTDLKGGFYFAWQLLKKDKSIFMPILTTLALPIMLLIFRWTEGRSLSFYPEPGQSIWQSTFPMLMIAIFFVMYFIHYGLRYSKDYEAAWSYQVNTPKQWNTFYLGVKLVILLRFLIPLFVVIGIIHAINVEWPIHIIQTFLILIMGLTGFVWFSIIFPRHPFSQKRIHRSGHSWPKFILSTIPLIFYGYTYYRILIHQPAARGLILLVPLLILLLLEIFGGRRIHRQLSRQVEFIHG